MGLVRHGLVVLCAGQLLLAAGCHGGTMADTDAGFPGTDALQPPDSDSGTGGPGTDSATGPADDINAGWIGGACDGDADCSYMDGYCLDEGEGFPGGMCSLPCSLYCPDADGAVTTFCIDPADVGLTGPDGLCTMRCDYGVSPTGCRPGYQCVALPRNGEPQSVVYACMPGDDMPFELSACHEDLIARGVSWTPGLNPLDHPAGYPNLDCDVTDPVWLDPYVQGVAYLPGGPAGDPSPMFVGCALAVAIDDASAVLAAEGVTDVVHYGTYNCRVIAGTDSLSQHGLANAIDLAGFVAADGSYWSVLDDWEDGDATPETAAGMFLLDFVQTLYDDYIFNIILTPEYNAAHDNHFHVDLTPGSHYLAAP